MWSTVVRRDVPLVGRAAQRERLRAVGNRRGAGHLVVSGPVGAGRSRLLAESFGEREGVAFLSGRSWSADDAIIGRLPSGSSLRVVVIDDADHLDAASAAAVADELAERDLACVLTSASGRPLAPGFAERLGPPELVELPPLTDVEVDRVLDRLVEQPIGLVARHRLRSLARGNPRFLCLVLQDALARGQLRKGPDGVLRLSTGHRPAGEVVTAVEESVGCLLPSAREVLRRLVVAGPLPLGLVCRIASSADLAALRQAGIVHLEHGDTASVHPLMREVLDAELAPEDRAHTAATLIEAIGTDHPDAPLAPATWHLARSDAADRGLLVAGSRAALERFRPQLAASLARLARRDAPNCLDAELALAEAQASDRRRTGHALARFGAVAASSAADDEQRARAARGRAEVLLSRRGDPAAARRVAEAGARAYPTRPSGRECAALAAWADVCDRGPAAALSASAHPAVAEPTQDAVTAVTQVLAGRSGEADRTLARSSAGTPPLPRWVRPLPDLAAVLQEAYGGDLAAARQRTAQLLAAAIRRDERPQIALWHVVTAHVAELSGDLAGAERACLDADVAAEDDDPFGVRPLAVGLRALVAAQHGAAAVADAVTDGVAGSAATGEAGMPWLTILRIRTAGWRAYLDGDDRTGARLAAEAGDLALGLGAPVWAALAYHDGARFGYPQVALAGVTVAAARADAELVTMLAQDLRARVAGVGQREAGDRLQGIGTRLLAAEAWLEAAEQVEEDAVAERLRRRAGTVLGTAAPPTAARAIVEVPTAREREVLALVATGATSAYVADHLGISVRTVDNHVARALRKLGADDRHDLARLLGVPIGPMPGPAPLPPSPSPRADRRQARTHRRSVRSTTGRRRTPPQDRAHV